MYRTGIASPNPEYGIIELVELANAATLAMGGITFSTAKDRESRRLVPDTKAIFECSRHEVVDAASVKLSKNRTNSAASRRRVGFIRINWQPWRNIVAYRR